MYSKETISVNNSKKHQYNGVNTPVFTSTANRYIGSSEIPYPRNFIPKKRLEQGITDALLRLSVGIENADDLIKDIEAALKA